MKYIVDTGTILDDPELLATAESHTLLIPQSVIRELHAHEASSGITEIFALINRALSRGAVIVEQPSNTPTKVLEDEQSRLSNADLDVLSLAIGLSKEQPITVVTDNKRLIELLKHYDIAYSSPKTLLDHAIMDDMALQVAKDIERRQLLFVGIRVLTGIVLFVVGYFIWWLIYKYTSHLLGYIPISIWGLIIFIFGVSLYWCRQRFRLAYATVELLVGLLTALTAIFDISTINEFLLIHGVQVLGGLYIIVRGLDNFGKGLEGTPMETRWKHWFFG